MNPRRLLLAKLNAVADQILKQLHHLRRIHHNRWQLIPGDHRLAFVDCHRQVFERRLHTGQHIHRLKGLAAPVDARISQQVFDQRLHTVGGIHRVIDILIGARIELTLVALLQKLHHASDGAQRFLQIVRRHIRKLLQFRVGAREFLQRSL